MIIQVIFHEVILMKRKNILINILEDEIDSKLIFINSKRIN